MLFNSFSFPLFLAVAWVVYRLLHRRKLPWVVWLLLCSAFFYGCWKPWYLILIFTSTLNSYVAGALIDRSSKQITRKRWLWLSICIDLGLLGVFKYGNFAIDNIQALLHILGFNTELGQVPTELPVGISFYTFQSLSYTIDVYRKRIPRSNSLLEFATYVCFFPQLVAGPIVRARDLLPQFAQRPRMDRAALGAGIFLILAGLTKKMVLADTLFIDVVQPYFVDVEGHHAIETITVMWAANFQVYCDFSGYSDVAIGAALLFGFHLPKNFDRPFQSRTPMEHWRRWHISLSTWLKDYLYIPLGGSQKGPTRTQINLVLTFLLGGLWHGAAWTFVFWGLYNGLLLVVWRAWWTKRAKSRVGIAFEIFITFNAICFGLIFLHAHSFSDAWIILKSLTNWNAPMKGALHIFGLSMLGIATVLHFSPSQWKQQLRTLFEEMPASGVAAAIVLIAGVLTLFAGFATPFFYFQF